jgi:hypothetical protein
MFAVKTMRVVDDPEEIALDALTAGGLITGGAVDDFADLRSEGLCTNVASLDLLLGLGFGCWRWCFCRNWSCDSLLTTFLHCSGLEGILWLISGRLYTFYF